ncbi:putative secreted protein with PEP-CTERM sorting signal [Pseudoduganella flava]|uniref:PEP-CTERM sorting domain-containing protein n=1 Tax=Pseudoduganella flava TaxID=871742 RepID=A0A562Q459_9BURK|nr:PEP-CTERM sorting domain-containing protein [Pseudoduganella flava]QGZ41563.1 PEP-CTERM sorting domain-containing protein [Pseudoduganella flava]TWI51541.1 putative secreted protein with PEP-CTERM sorting signal [Pseudoduganella flava]
MNMKHASLVLALSFAAGSAAAATTDFSSGAQGWTGMQPANGVGGSGIDTSLGNGAPAYRTVLENFGISFTNKTNTDFVRDYTATSAVTFGIDVLAQEITYFGQNVTRDLVLELRDYDNASNGLPYTSVWYTLGTLDASASGWQHFSVTIGNTAGSALPAGWGGYGAEDATGMPLLPADRTFASVLAGVDEIAFTTLKPGWAYGFTQFDVAIDNITVSAVPEPGETAMLMAGLGVLGAVARRRRSRRSN